MIVKEIVQYLI